MSMDTQQAQQVEQAEQEWIRWHEERTATVSAPYGPLSLTGTHWLSDHPEGRIPAVPGQWQEDGDEVVLTAAAEDGLTVDGKPFTGEVRLTADRGAIETSRVAHGERRLVVLSREELWAVRTSTRPPRRENLPGHRGDVVRRPLGADGHLPSVRHHPLGPGRERRRSRARTRSRR